MYCFDFLHTKCELLKNGSSFHLIFCPSKQFPNEFMDPTASFKTSATQHDVDLEKL